LTGSQKELLLSRWLASRNEASLPQAIIPKLAGECSCKDPLCDTCLFAKQHRKGPGKANEIKPAYHMQFLKSNHLQPGDKISINQYISTVPGCKIPRRNWRQTQEIRQQRSLGDWLIPYLLYKMLMMGQSN